MTPIPPNADELVSAYLDGEAAPDEIALVESNEQLLARVETLRGLSAQLGAAAAPAPEVKEAHLAAALGAFDELMADTESKLDAPVDRPTLKVVEDEPSGPKPVATSSPPATDPVVRSLDAARDRRGFGRRNGLIAAAAAVALLFVGLTAFSLRSGDESLDVASSPSSVDEASGAGDSLGSLSDSGTDRISPPQAPAAAQIETADDASDAVADSFVAEEEAMEDVEEMAEEEEAMDADAGADGQGEDDAGDVDAAADEAEEVTEADSSAESGADDAADRAPIDDRYFLGDFATLDELEELIRTDYGPDDLASKAIELPQGLFSNCQTELPALASTDPPTLVGGATVADETVEIHLLGDSQVLIIDATGCDISRQFTLPAG